MTRSPPPVSACRVWKAGHKMRVPCRKQMTSGNSREKQSCWPATPKPTTSNVCFTLHERGPKQRYWSEQPLVITLATLRSAPRDAVSGGQEYIQKCYAGTLMMVRQAGYLRIGGALASTAPVVTLRLEGAVRSRSCRPRHGPETFAISGSCLDGASVGAFHNLSLCDCRATFGVLCEHCN